MTYVLLSLGFLLIALAVLIVAVARRGGLLRFRRRWLLPVVLTGVALTVLTAVFDNLMVAVGLMTYAAADIAGPSVGLVPLADFAYPLAGLMLLPALWLLLRPRSHRERERG